MSITPTIARAASLAALVLLAAAPAHAGLFGWTTTIQATNGRAVFEEGITAPTRVACEFKRSNAINAFLAQGYTILDAPGCSHLMLRLPEVIPELLRELPDPGCVSCPYVTDSLIDRIYPGHADQVRALVEKYRIDAYNEELAELRSRYDLEGFESRMLEVEIDQQLDPRQGLETGR